MLFGDEMGVRAGQKAGKTYSPRRQRAVVKLTGKRFSANVISAVGADGDAGVWTSCWHTFPTKPRSS